MDYYGMTNRRLVGCVIDSIDLDKGKDTLTITLVDGSRRVYTTEGDCCSQSWVEHLTVPPDIKGATITGIEELEEYGRDATPEETAKSDAEREYGVDVLRIYQTAIVTDRGEVVIEYRNDSNGYYGGWLRETNP